MLKNILYVDGYNMIGSWPTLTHLQRSNQLADARDLLLEMLSEYAKYEKIETRVVFDALFVPGMSAQYDYQSLTVIFTREGETADEYIEREVGNENLLISRVQVATSDLAEQWMIFQRGASRKSARELYEEVLQTKAEIADETRRYNARQIRRSSPFSADDQHRLRRYYYKLVEDERATLASARGLGSTIGRLATSMAVPLILSRFGENEKGYMLAAT